MTKQQDIRELMTKLLGKVEADKIFALIEELRKEEKDVKAKEEALAKALCEAMKRIVLPPMIESEFHR